jgi:SulP family sulfate permease
VIGRLGELGDSVGGDFIARWAGLGNISLDTLELILVPALTLSVLLSIDTLKTCVLVDTLTFSRHDSNREILGQGITNLCAVTAGGVPGAGTAGATLVNIASGGRTRYSSLLAGVFALVTSLALGRLMAWLPIAALAGILVVIAYHMFDWQSVKLLRHRSTVFDFVVTVTVVVLAVTIGLVVASGVGVALALLLSLGNDSTYRRLSKRNIMA